MQVDKDKKPLAGLKVGHGERAAPFPAIILGPLLGLGYILVLPFIGIPALILALGYRGKESLATMRRGVTRTIADAQEKTRIEAVGLSDLLQPLIDRLECEFMVVDRELRITKYHTPLSRRNKLLEQTAIGQHCFEVSHGRNSPCESCECECPVSRVLETNDKVTVTHYHENQLARKGVKRPVEVLASPVRDSQGNITHVAELIWDINTTLKNSSS